VLTVATARIEAIGVHVPTGLVYADVSVWPGPTGQEPAPVRNDFLIEVTPFSEAIRTDLSGQWITMSGRAVIPYIEVDGDWVQRPEDPADPWRRELVRVDQAAVVLDAVASYARRSPPAGDHRGIDPAAEVTGSGLAAELQALAGQVITID
jgi:hypothetical protein